jgi:hypothetical protein
VIGCGRTIIIVDIKIKQSRELAARAIGRSPPLVTTTDAGSRGRGGLMARSACTGLCHTLVMQRRLGH